MCTIQHADAVYCSSSYCNPVSLVHPGDDMAEVVVKDDISTYQKVDPGTTWDIVFRLKSGGTVTWVFPSQIERDDCFDKIKIEMGARVM